MNSDIHYSRDRNLFNLENQEFDLLVVGGGIIGAGILRDAVLRGLSVALIEAKDFASGTSSKSSKLLHGGIRYLENLEFGLVYESSRERRLHSDFLSPHLTQSVPFMTPVYKWSPHSLPTVCLGVGLYNAMALFRNKNTNFYRKDSLLQAEPLLAADQLQGGASFHDVVMDDARINLENIKFALEYGATAANYIKLRGFEKNSNGRIVGVWARDNSPVAEHLNQENLGEGKDIFIRAKAVVNATGPWSDYIRRLANSKAKSILRPTKGVHLVLPREKINTNSAFVLTAKKDNRVFFSIPWFDRVLIGTTDTDYEVASDSSIYDVCADQSDIDYLLDGVHRSFPNANIKESDIISTFAGLRPLIAGDPLKSESATSREHKVFVENDTGLITIAGGKYTTYRAIAEEVMVTVLRYLRKSCPDFNLQKVSSCKTASLELVVPPAELLSGNAIGQMGVVEEYNNMMGVETIQHLQSRYGSRWKEVADIAVSDKQYQQRIVDSELDIQAEAVYAKKKEMAICPEDFFRRRTMLALKVPLDKEIGKVESLSTSVFGDELKIDVDLVRKWKGKSNLSH